MYQRFLRVSRRRSTLLSFIGGANPPTTPVSEAVEALNHKAFAALAGDEYIVSNTLAQVLEPSESVHCVTPYALAMAIDFA